MNHSSVTPILIALLSAVALTACKTTRSSSSSEASNTHWAKSSAESLQRVSEASLPDATPLASPNLADGNVVAAPLGAPRNLTRPVSVGREIPSNTAARKTPTALSGNANPSPSVTINVNAVEEPTTNEQSPSGQPRSRLEELYLGGFDRSADRELEQFGYGFLSKELKDLQSIGPVPSSYIIGPEDEMIITLSGGVDAYHRLTVDRDGFLHIPEFGPVAVGGQRYSEVDKTILGFLNERRIGFDLTVSMGRLRSIRVNIVGQAQMPGAVEVPASSTPIQALAASGGLLKTGSMRKIRLIRAGSDDPSPQVIDLYKLLLSSPESTQTIALQDGDTLHVPEIGPTIGIAGYVKRPAIYELANNSIDIENALNLAGGLTAFSFTPLAHIEKTIEGRGRQRVGVELTAEGLAGEMSDGELLLIEAVDGERQPIVRIEGEISRPGDYEFQAGMTLSAIIGRADGLTIDAYLPQAFVSRQLGDADSIMDVIGRSAHKRSRRVIVCNLEHALNGDPTHDIVLMPLDLITIRSSHESSTQPIVEIIGSVKNPGRFELTAGMRVSDLVAIAGNPTHEAFYDEAELIRKTIDEKTKRIDAQRYRFSLRSALAANESTANLDPILTTGDKLIIRSLQESQVRVRIEGSVRFPGEYVFPARARISDLIAAAGGILDDADLRAASFLRESTRQLQRQRIEHLEERTRRLFENALERMIQTGQARESIAANLSLAQSIDTINRIHQNEADGRIVIPFDRPDFPLSDFDLELENGDLLKVPRKHTTISVAGHVFRPISLVATESIDIAFALEQAGGLTDFADEKQLYVIRADGSVKSVAQTKRPLRKSDRLLPGDVLLAPQKAVDRTFGAKLGDTLALAQQAAELGLISAGIGRDTDFTIVHPNPSSSHAKVEDIFVEQLQ